MLKAPIVEVFTSVQGEGISLGTPSTFIRFFGCNLRCRFKGTHCDTPYAVLSSQNKSILMTPHQVFVKVMQSSPTNIVFTGGEPFLYQLFMIEVMRRLNKKGNHFTAEVETNGTIPVRDKCLLKYINQFNVSPKLKNSNQPDKEFDDLRINYEALNTLYLPHKAYFKFVVEDLKDLSEVETLKKKYPYMTVYLMPEGVDRKTIIKNSKKVVDMCIKTGFRFSPREHILIWDRKRGV